MNPKLLLPILALLAQVPEADECERMDFVPWVIKKNHVKLIQPISVSWRLLYLMGKSIRLKYAVEKGSSPELCGLLATVAGDLMYLISILAVYTSKIALMFRSILDSGTIFREPQYYANCWVPHTSSGSALYQHKVPVVFGKKLI